MFQARAGSTRLPCNTISIQLSLNMTDRDVMVDLGDTLNLKVTGPYDYTNRPYASKQNKPFWKVSVQKKSEVKRILSLLLPHLGSRRAYKALNALDVIECNLSPENTDISKL